MHFGKDPAQIRAGINLASLDDEAKAGKVAETLNDVLARVLNLVRIVVVAAPVVVQSLFMHSESVDLLSWLLRLASALVAPEQAFNGMALRELRWVFQWLYPEASLWNGSPAPEQQADSPSLLAGSGATLEDLSDVRVRLRWHGSDRYLCLDADGWAAPGGENFAATLLLQPVMVKGEHVPDTYTLKVFDEGGRWGECWLACTPVNHLRFGGWLRSFRDVADACPFKLLQDSSCAVGACKVLSAYQTPPQQEAFGLGKGCACAGFYLAEQRHGGRLYVGQSPDVDASFFELVLQH